MLFSHTSTVTTAFRQLIASLAASVRKPMLQVPFIFAPRFRQPRNYPLQRNTRSQVGHDKQSVDLQRVVPMSYFIT